MIDELHAWAWRRWHDKAEAKAMLNARYAEIKNQTYDPQTHLTRFDADLFRESSLLFRQINPHPWWHVTYHRYVKCRSSVWDIKRFWERGRHGVGTTDVWSFDRYLARVLTQGLTILRANLHSHPADITYEDWVQVLDRMIAGFSEYDEVSCDDPAVQEALALLVEYFPHLWD